MSEKLKVFLEVHGRDIDFVKSEQSYHLTSTDAEDSSVAESSYLTLALATHTKNIKSFDG